MSGNLITLARTPPPAGSGRPLGVGNARWVVELALPNASNTWGTGTWGNAVWSSPFQWVDITGRFRGASWSRGAEVPGDRPRTGTLDSLELDNADFGLSRWTNAPATGPGHAPYYSAGTLVRLSVIDGTRWYPQFTGAAETWDVLTTARHGNNRVVITAADPMSHFAGLNTLELAAPIGEGDSLSFRLARLAELSDFPFDFHPPTNQPTTTLQGTTVADNRLAEIHRTTDSVGRHAYCNRFGALTYTRGIQPAATPVYPDPTATGSTAMPTVVLSDRHNSGLSGTGYALEAPFDADSFQVLQDVTTVRNVIRLARAGGQERAAVSLASIGWYGAELPTTRYDLIVQSDAAVATLANQILTRFAWDRLGAACSLSLHNANADPATMLTVLAGYELNYRLPVWWRELNRRITLDTYLSAMSHRVDVIGKDRLQWQADLTLVSASSTAVAGSGFATLTL